MGVMEDLQVPAVGQSVVAMDKNEFEKFGEQPHCGKAEVEIKTGLTLFALYAGIYENGAPTNGIVNINQPWDVKVGFGLKGPLRELICGKWCITAHFESIGNAPEFDVDVEPHIHFDCHNEYWCVRIPGPRLDTAHCGRPYKIAVTVAYKSMCGKPAGIIGYVELPMTEFYRA
ncbi:MAG: hypothetical protein ACKVQT_23965 [Burkholderiales bacterium]